METRDTALLIVGHGNYATSIKTSIEMIVGSVENVSYLDFKEEDSLDILIEKLGKELEALKAFNVLVVADMVGGAPFQQAAILSIDNENINVIGGVNLSAILEVVFSLHLSMDEIAKTMIETTINSVKVMR